MQAKSDQSIKILSGIGESYALLEGSPKLKQAISLILPILGKASEVDRVYVFRNLINSEGVFCLTYLDEWCGEGISPQMDNQNLVEVPWSIFPELEEDLHNNQVQNKLVRDSLNETFIELMTQQGIISYLFIPIVVDKDFWGFIGFDNCTNEELFASEQVSALHALATTLGHLIFAKKSLKKALKNQKKYKQIVANIEDIVLKLDSGLNILYLNGAWFKITGRRIQDCIGHPINEFLFEEGSKEFLAGIQNMNLIGEQRISILTEIKKSNGEGYYIRINLKKIVKGEKIEFFGTIHDKHQTQINLELLKESESRYKSLFDTVDDILYSIDFNTLQVLIVSDKIERFGFKKDNFLNVPNFWWSKILPEDFPDYQFSFEEFLKMRSPIFEHEYRIKKSDGNIAWIYDKCVIEYNQENMPVRLHGRISDITEQKNKELLIVQTENRFKTITENLPFPFALIGAEDSNILYCNFSFAKFIQGDPRQKETVNNLWINEIVPAELLDVFEEFLHANSNFSNYETMLNTCEGQQWYNLSCQLISYKLGHARAITFYNINKRKLGELELIRMNDVIQALSQTQMEFSMENEIHDTFYMLLKSLIEFTGSAFGFLGEVLFDEKGMPYLKSNATSNISWNDEVLEYYQKNFRAGMEFRNLNSLFGYVMVNKELVISNDVANDPRRSPQATPPGHPDLKRFLGIPIIKGERLVGMVGLANKEESYSQEDVEFLKPFLSSYANLIASLNLNRQKRKAELLQLESESLYRILSENIDDIVSLHDLDFKTVYASPSFEKVTGVNLDLLIGRNIFSFLNFKLQQNYDFTKYPRFVIPLKNRISGKEIRLEMLWKPLYGEQGELRSYLAASRDVTDRELVLEELKRTLEKEIELNQLKSKFISMTSHELRTPLATIQSSADLMEIITDDLKEKKAHGGLVKQIRKIHVQLNRLTNIISDVMLFEKNTEGKLIYIQKDVDIKSLLVQLVFNQFGIIDNEARIIIELGSEPVMLRSDPTLLIHVFRNLIENAIKYTPEGSPKPILRVLPNKKSIEIHVVDFGIGIPQNEAKYIYDTFYRASNVKNIKGTGLGLSIVNDLVVNKLMGKISFISEENQGTTFIISLPYAR